jgi:uncharacterized membrane protein
VTGKQTVSVVGGHLVHTVEGQQWLDRPSYKLEHLLALTFNLLGSSSKPAQDVLHGRWLGHPLHSVLTDLPVGAWTTALVLDGVDTVTGAPHRFGDAAQSAVGLGIIGGIGAALAGVTDWQYTHDNARRTGLVHGTMNAAALMFYVSSWRDRRRGRRGRALLCSTLGYGVVLASTYLGGTLVYRHRIGVHHADDQLEPRDFVPTVPVDELVEDVPRRVEHDGAGAVLIRHGNRVFGVGEHCAHLGAPVGEGWMQPRS